MPSTCTSHLTHEKELCSVVLSHSLLLRPTAFLLNGRKCNEADFKGMGLSPESRKAEESLEEQKDEFQREPVWEFLSAGISAELVFHHRVHLCSVCVSGDASLKPLPVALSSWGCAEPWYSNLSV